MNRIYYLQKISQYGFQFLEICTNLPEVSFFSLVFFLLEEQFMAVTGDNVNSATSTKNWIWADQNTVETWLWNLKSCLSRGINDSVSNRWHFVQLCSSVRPTKGWRMDVGCHLSCSFSTPLICDPALGDATSGIVSSFLSCGIHLWRQEKKDGTSVEGSFARWCKKKIFSSVSEAGVNKRYI